MESVLSYGREILKLLIEEEALDSAESGLWRRTAGHPKYYEISELRNELKEKKLV